MLIELLASYHSIDRDGVSHDVQIVVLKIHDPLPRLVCNKCVADIPFLRDFPVKRFRPSGYPVDRKIWENLPNDLQGGPDRKSTRLNSSHMESSYAVIC